MWFVASGLAIITCTFSNLQALTGLKLEQLRLQLAEEIEEPFRKVAILIRNP